METNTPQKNLLFIFGILLYLIFPAPVNGDTLELRSPDKKIKIQLFTDSQIQLSILVNDQVILNKSPISQASILNIKLAKGGGWVAKIKSIEDDL